MFDTVLGTDDTAVNKANKKPCSWGKDGLTKELINNISGGDAHKSGNGAGVRKAAFR